MTSFSAFHRSLKTSISILILLTMQCTVMHGRSILVYEHAL